MKLEGGPLLLWRARGSPTPLYKYCTHAKPGRKKNSKIYFCDEPLSVDKCRCWLLVKPTTRSKFLWCTTTYHESGEQPERGRLHTTKLRGRSPTPARKRHQNSTCKTDVQMYVYCTYLLTRMLSRISTDTPRAAYTPFVRTSTTVRSEARDKIKKKEKKTGWKTEKTPDLLASFSPSSTDSKSIKHTHVWHQKPPPPHSRPSPAPPRHSEPRR